MELKIAKNFPIGLHDFKEMSQSPYYVDKTLMIREVLDRGSKSTLFTRPRRFGKTSNMSMLKAFFEKTDGKDTSELFKDKKIWQCGEAYTSEQGKYPVVWLSFQEYEALDFESACRRFIEIVAAEFDRHQYLLHSDSLNDANKEKYERILRESSDVNDYVSSLKFLTTCLQKHWDSKVVVIVDEYDKVMQEGYAYGYYDAIVNIYRPFLSGAVKDNDALKYSFLTGIMNLGKDSSFSTLNNVDSYSIFETAYDQCFGFTRDEVGYLLEKIGRSDCMDDICEWYDGYVFGETEIFNPWSILKCLQCGVKLQGYWVNVGSNKLLGMLVDNLDKSIYSALLDLISGKEIEVAVNTNAVYKELKADSATIYSILLSAGYLRGVKLDDSLSTMRVKIPNREIMDVFETEVVDKLKNKISQQDKKNISDAIKKSDFDAVKNIVIEYMLESASSHDLKDENSYHLLMLGLIFPLRSLYRIRSNIESGDGRYDILLQPFNHNDPALIFEFKYNKKKRIKLDVLADGALQQIIDRKYDTDLRALGYTKIVAIGIAFQGKDKVEIKTKEL